MRTVRNSQQLCTLLVAVLAVQSLCAVKSARLLPSWLSSRADVGSNARHEIRSAHNPFQLLSPKHSHVLPIDSLGNLKNGVQHQPVPLEASSVDPSNERVATVFGPGSHMQLHHLVDDDNAVELDMNLAMLAGRLTSVAYCRVPQVWAWNCTRCLAAGSEVQVASVIFDEAWDLTAYVGFLPSSNTITVSFKGTDSSSIANWMRNLQSWRLDKAYPMPEAPHALIHIGFYNMWHYSRLEGDVTAAIGQLLAAHPTAELLVTGHSMGGALAQLCALDMKFEFNVTRVRVVTFGAPRVGNQAYTELFSDAMTESWRFTHNRDIVPSLPPLLVGFRHVSREVWQVDVESDDGVVQEKILMCDSSGEDPSCHNSACFLGICTSIADHLTYLGLHMYHNEDEC